MNMTRHEEQKPDSISPKAAAGEGTPSPQVTTH